MNDLLERLWASDEASALTNEAAREIERLRKTQIPSLDNLAQIIRVVDGNNSLGAGALAEGIIAKIREAQSDV